MIIYPVLCIYVYYYNTYSFYRLNKNNFKIVFIEKHFQYVGIYIYIHIMWLYRQNNYDLKKRLIIIHI